MIRDVRERNERDVYVLTSTLGPRFFFLPPLPPLLLLLLGCLSSATSVLGVFTNPGAVFVDFLEDFFLLPGFSEV